MKEEIKDENIKSENCECSSTNNSDSCDCINDTCTCDNECDCKCDDVDNCECDDCCESNDLKKNKKEKKDKHKEKFKELEKKIEELENKNKELSNQTLRSQAELINYRKRKDDELSRMLKYAGEDMIKELLQILDNFERAINMDDDNLEDEVSKFLSGFNMIYCKFVSILEKNGVKAIDGGNKPFDPTYHQAVMTEVREGVEPGMVLEVLQKGYLLKDKVIRPAMVKVSE